MNHFTELPFDGIDELICAIVERTFDNLIESMLDMYKLHMQYAYMVCIMKIHEHFAIYQCNTNFNLRIQYPRCTYIQTLMHIFSGKTSATVLKAYRRI